MKLDAKLSISILVVFITIIGFATNLPADERQKNVIAKVFGADVTLEEIGLSSDVDISTIVNNSSSCSEDNPMDKLERIIYRKVLEDFINNNQLKATADEMEELKDCLDWFNKQEGIKNEKEFKNIKLKLQSESLSVAEKNKLEEDKKTLRELVKYYRKSEKTAKEYKLTENQMREMYAPWVEVWKTNKALFEKYGGVVEATKFGPRPIGAQKALLKEYQRLGYFKIFDKHLRKLFWECYRPDPNLILSKDEIGFIPFWVGFHSSGSEITNKQ